MFRTYQRQLQTIQEQEEATPELSLREPLLQLIRWLARQAGRTLLIAQEANAGTVGQPDVFVKDGPRLVGFVETKPPGSNLRHMLRKNEQLKRYKTNLPNWVLTDYYSFLFLRDGHLTATVSLDHTNDLQTAFTTFFAYAPPVIRTPKRLAQELARRATLLCDGLLGAIQVEPPDGPLSSLLDFYRNSLMDDLDDQRFSDTFAQTTVYGLFVSWLSHEHGQFSRTSALRSFPRSIPFLRSSLRLLTDEDVLPRPVIRLLDDLAALLDNTNAAHLRAQISAGGLEADLVLYFYEHFLEKYNPKIKKERAVYYTPPALVHYLVRAIQTMLHSTFRLRSGLADPSVVILDPAVGTGTFLLGAADTALAAVRHRGTAAQKDLIETHILPHFFGFELLPAPYAIAHMKLGTFFQHYRYQLRDNQRLQVYLTNTLQLQAEGEIPHLHLPLYSGLVAEGIEAGRIKRESPVLVILGNPPYDRKSHNANRFSNRLQQDFYRIDGERIPDRNSAPLKDDYLRFIRWAVWKLLEQQGAPGHGILAFVTNRAFIERKLHRGVRRFLLEKFDDIYVLDLHGDQREWYRDRVDEKVFKNVQAGIALTVFVKKPEERDGAQDLATVRYQEFFGTREEKFHACKHVTLDGPGWRTLAPRAPLWMCQDYDVPRQYDEWPLLSQLFSVRVTGVQTHRDQLVVAFTENELRERLRDFGDNRVADAFWIEQGVQTTRDWDLQNARAALRAEPPRNVMRWTFRPFDTRWVAFDDRLIEYSRTAVSPHLLKRRDNLTVAFSYGSLTDGPYAFVARTPVPAGLLSWRTFGQAHFAPELVLDEFSGQWEPNLRRGFLERMAELGVETDCRGFVGYVYAVLNARVYREQMAHGLRYDVARLPIAEDAGIFQRISALGQRLIGLHLLEDPDCLTEAAVIDGEPRSELCTPVFDEGREEIRVADELVVRGVSEEVWTYTQGAYQVLRKYFEDRENRVLSGEELERVALITGAIRRTQMILPELDRLVAEVFGRAFTATLLGIPGEGGDEADDGEREEE